MVRPTLYWLDEISKEEGYSSPEKKKLKIKRRRKRGAEYNNMILFI